MGRKRKGGKIRHVPVDLNRTRIRFAQGTPRNPGDFPKRKKRDKTFTHRNIDSAVLESKPQKSATTSKERRENPRRKTITQEQRALLDDTFSQMDTIEGMIQEKKSEIRDSEADFRKLYNSLDADGRADYFRRIYDNFSEIYDYVMGSTGHFGAIREVLPIGRKFLKTPILDITAGTYEVLKYALEQMNMPKDIRVLLNQYKILLDSNPKCPIFESQDHLAKVGSSIDSILPEFGRGYFNRSDDFLVWANEISPKMSKKGKEKLKGHDIRHTAFNATELPEEMEGKFMTVICAQTFHLISKIDKMNLIKSIYRALKPGGYAIIIEEENFRISPTFDLKGVGIPLRAAACPIDKKSDFISMFTRFEDKEGNPIGFEYRGIGSKMEVDKKPGHIMRSYVFRKPLRAEHLADSATKIYDLQANEGLREIRHNSGHMLRCAIAAANYVDLNQNGVHLKNKDELIQVAAITGLLHDFVRTSQETEGRSSKQIAADLIEYIAGSNVTIDNGADYRAVRLKLGDKLPEEMRIITDFLKEYPDYIAMISQVISMNEGSIQDIENEISKMSKMGLDTEALLCKALMYADKGFERLGQSAIIRRAQSVSGERADDPEDIGALWKTVERHGFDNKDFRLLAFIGDSMIKMYNDKPARDMPSEDAWTQLFEMRQSEAKIYDALIYYFEENHGWGEKEVFEFLLNCGFPKMEKSKDMILGNISDKEKLEPDRNYADDAVRLVLSLAYSQSADAKRKVESEMIGAIISDKEIKSIIAESDVDELKKEFAGFFEK